MSDQQFVILADESAHWKIAGLTQLERLLLALNEFAGTTEQLVVTVFGRPDLPSTSRRLPNDPRWSRVRLTESPTQGARSLSTHLFVHRKALANFFATTAPVEFSEDISWQQLAGKFEGTCRTAKSWRFVHTPNEIALAEDDFLRRTSKPQDGFVSRFVNRPLTRPITQLLLKFPIKPTTWTLSIFALPLIAGVFLWRGGYASIIIGTAIYQLYSMLDGCDGEIARAKFLESKRGGRVDDLCDIAGALLFVIALGVGLSRSHGSLYAAEGIVLAILIAANEWALRIPDAEAPTTLSEAAYPRHRRLLRNVGRSRFGEKIVWCVLQGTKRDVGILFFLLLALAGLPQWILHPWLLVTLTTLVLNALSQLRALA